MVTDRGLTIKIYGLPVTFTLSSMSPCPVQCESSPSSEAYSYRAEEALCLSGSDSAAHARPSCIESQIAFKCRIDRQLSTLCSRISRLCS